MTARGAALFAGSLLIAASACGGSAKPEDKPAPAAAKVSAPRTEADLAIVTLTPEAEQRLGITTVPVERRQVRRTRLLGGEVILPGALGQQWPVAPAERLRLAESLAAVEGELARARVELNAATNELSRAERLRRDGAGSARQVEDARARVETARATLGGAEERRRLLGGAFGTIPETVWIRVPVSVTDRGAIEATGDVLVAPLSRESKRAARPAQRVQGPPSANPEGATVDLFFALPNGADGFRLGERVSVILELNENETALVVPRAALLYDIHGGEWVYARTDEHSYSRRRVEVRPSAGEELALARGPEPGTPVVTDGAAEIFGVEFGVGH